MKNTVLLVVFFLLLGCSNDDSYKVIENPVDVELENVPYQKLSEYNFFVGDLSKLTPHSDLLLYKPNSELFTDYAKKLRYVWLPENTKAEFVSENESLNLPVGSVLLKVFYYDTVQTGSQNKILETRLMIRKEEGWIFANYKWNDSQTEAFYDMSTSTVPLTINHNNQNLSFDYTIPSDSQCLSCHSKNAEPQPIGIKPIYLNYSLSGRNQLQNWISKGHLESDLPQAISSVVDYSDSSKSLNDRARAYLDIQCAHCHNPEGSSYYVPLDFSFSQTINSENMGVCMSSTMNIPGFDRGYIVAAQDPINSALLYMISTDQPQYKMPRFGRTLTHQVGVELISQWINSLEPCPSFD